MGDTVKCSLQLGASPARCRLNWRRVLPDLWCLLACPSGNQIWRMTVTPFAAATATEASLATFGFVWQQMSALWHHDTTAQCSLCLTEWHSYGMQQKMRPYPQPAARGTKVCGDSRQLGQQHHHYITWPRQIRESERKRARARVSHLPRGIGANVRARAATDKSPPSQAAPPCRRCTPHLTRSPSAHLLLLCALSHYNGSQLPFTASKLGARAARPVCRSPLMWLLLPAPLRSALFRSIPPVASQPASSACLVCPSSVPPAACRIISHFPGAPPPAPLLSPFVVVLVLILLAACRLPLCLKHGITDIYIQIYTTISV